MSYTATTADQTHPVYNPADAEDKDFGQDIKFNFKRRSGTDALMLKEHKMDNRANIKSTKRLEGTWRLKQKNVDTSKIMEEYKRKAKVETVDPNDKSDLDAMDRHREMTYYLVSAKDVDGHIENELAEREKRQNLRYNVERRYAKDDMEM